jgi:hypothetical protein
MVFPRIDCSYGGMTTAQNGKKARLGACGHTNIVSYRYQQSMDVAWNVLTRRRRTEEM